MRNLAKGEQMQFNRAANFGFYVGVVTVSGGALLGILVSFLIKSIF